MSQHKTIIESDDIARYLRIAKRYAQYIRRAKEIRIPSILSDHATIVNVFSAAAIEAALNLFIALPLLSIKEPKTRSFYGSFVTKYVRLSIRKKISFAKSLSSELKNSSKLCEKVNAIFDNRNSYLHISPIYSETIGIDFSRMRGVNWDAFKKRPYLKTISLGSQDILDSLNHYSTALKFIELLDMDNSERLGLNKKT